MCLQIFLDNSNFGPGKIDGQDGEFTRKAITLFKRSQGQADSAVQNSETPIDTTGLDLASFDPVFTTYLITKGDIGNGCIRLANWDVAKLAGMVKPGVPVVVE
jgi:peptidoglycan hydrolase-like protein with peptidoglycan-binding domain